MSRVLTLWHIRIADLLDSGFGIRCYRLMLAGSGSRGYCMGATPHLTQWTSTPNTRPGAPTCPPQIRHLSGSVPTSARSAGWQQCPQNGRTDSRPQNGQSSILRGLQSITRRHLFCRLRNTWIATPKLHSGDSQSPSYSLYLRFLYFLYWTISRQGGYRSSLVVFGWHVKGFNALTH